MNVPENRPLDGLEAKWGPAWEDAGTNRPRLVEPRPGLRHRYAAPDGDGSLHIGHVLSYTHTDLMARNKRMRGVDVAPCCRADSAVSEDVAQELEDVARLGRFFRDRHGEFLVRRALNPRSEPL